VKVVSSSVKPHALGEYFPSAIFDTPRTFFKSIKNFVQYHLTLDDDLQKIYKKTWLRLPTSAATRDRAWNAIAGGPAGGGKHLVEILCYACALMKFWAGLSKSEFEEQRATCMHVILEGMLWQHKGSLPVSKKAAN
jgi:hypothetical protein